MHFSKLFYGFNFIWYCCTFRAKILYSKAQFHIKKESRKIFSGNDLCVNIHENQGCHFNLSTFPLTFSPFRIIHQVNLVFLATFHARLGTPDIKSSCKLPHFFEKPVSYENLIYSPIFSKPWLLAEIFFARNKRSHFGTKRRRIREPRKNSEEYSGQLPKKPETFEIFFLLLPRVSSFFTNSQMHKTANKKISRIRKCAKISAPKVAVFRLENFGTGRLIIRINFIIFCSLDFVEGC